MNGGGGDYLWVLMGDMRHANTMFRIMSTQPVAATALVALCGNDNGMR